MVDYSDTDEDGSEQRTFDNTRRQFVAGSAGALGGLAVGSTFAGSALAQDEGTPTGTDSGTPTGTETEEPAPEDEFEDDVAILNYALTLEYLEAKFYQEGLDNIGEEGLCTCKALSQDSPLAERAFDELRTIKSTRRPTSRLWWRPSRTSAASPSRSRPSTSATASSTRWRS